MHPVWQRLRSRKIVEWMIGYLAGAFGLLQIADVLEGAFSWHPSVLRVLTVVVAFGFLAVLVLAWYHGEKGHQRAQGVELALLAAIALGTIGTSWYVAQTTPRSDDPASTAAPPAAETGNAQLALFDPATARQSVAVLPFVNMTPDAENDYITDGITEDIISEIGRIEDLRVISRTSVQRYRDTEKAIPEIGAELGVGAILEGSVRVQGDQVRIVAQLIDVATDSHIWTATYDRTFSDMFAVQTEVAREIAQALGARLSPTVLASNDAAEVDPDAWRQYMRGRTLASSSSDAERRQAEVFLDSAIAIAPDFAPALAALADLRTPIMLDIDTGEMIAETEAQVDEAVRAAEQAVQLDPNLADAQSSLAMMRALRGQDLAGAEKTARQAIRTNPNSVSARLRYAQILFAAGRHDDAMEQAGAAAALDPMSPEVHTHVAEFALSAGRTAEAKAHAEKAMSLDSTDAHPHVVMASIHRREGRQEEAIRELEKAAAMEPEDLLATAQLAGALAGAGRVDEARMLIVRLEHEAREGRPVQALIAPIYMNLGQVEEAVDWVVKANEEGRRAFFMMPPGARRAFDSLLENPVISKKLDSLGVRIELRRDSTRRGPDRPPTLPGGRSGSREGR